MACTYFKDETGKVNCIICGPDVFHRFFIWTFSFHKYLGPSWYISIKFFRWEYEKDIYPGIYNPLWFIFTRWHKKYLKQKQA